MRVKHAVVLLSAATFGLVAAGCSDDDDDTIDATIPGNPDLNPGDGTGLDVDPGEGSGLPGDADDEGTDAPEATDAPEVTVAVETTSA